jgi:hypothetical protein
MAQIPPDFLDTVVAIGNRDESGATQWVASGFLFGQFQKTQADGRNSYRIYLVTNKHVIADLSQSVFRANPQGTDPAREFELSLKDPGSGEQMWVGHKDPDVDVVVTGLNVEYLQSEGIILRFFTSDRLACTSAEMVEEEFLRVTMFI